MESHVASAVTAVVRTQWGRVDPLFRDRVTQNGWNWKEGVAAAAGA
jgi:hypothetical protein